jgi:hypothetical protein
MSILVCLVEWLFRYKLLIKYTKLTESEYPPIIFITLLFLSLRTKDLHRSRHPTVQYGFHVDPDSP